MASSGAMMAQTYSYIIPQSRGMVIVPCKKETRSNSKLCRDRKVPKRPTCQRRVAEAGSNHLAGRDAPPAGLSYFVTIAQLFWYGPTVSVARTWIAPVPFFEGSGAFPNAYI